MKRLKLWVCFFTEGWGYQSFYMQKKIKKNTKKIDTQEVVKSSFSCIKPPIFKSFKEFGDYYRRLDR